MQKQKKRIVMIILVVMFITGAGGTIASVMKYNEQQKMNKEMEKMLEDLGVDEGVEIKDLNQELEKMEMQGKEENIIKDLEK